ncbi:MAG TPA: hypothetical protein VFB21_08035 [Chthonomonadaceae bacterium]|nr:hypothetical protein [Chthonomonadaceae bacterium]
MLKQTKLNPMLIAVSAIAVIVLAIAMIYRNVTAPGETIVPPNKYPPKGAAKFDSESKR